MNNYEETPGNNSRGNSATTFERYSERRSCGDVEINPAKNPRKFPWVNSEKSEEELRGNPMRNPENKTGIRKKNLE